MSIYDREYSQRGGGGGGFDFRRLLEMLNSSFSIGTYLGIHVRVHIAFVLLLVIEMLVAGDQALWAVRWMGLLFFSVLLHEFGHCIACRRVGGEANEVLMWPLGGLAYCRPPHTPFAEFFTVAGGPVVNVIIGGLAFILLAPLVGSQPMPVSLNPFNMWVAYPGPGLSGWLADIFVVNYALLLFNMCLIFYPFDGGRLVQIALWVKVGYVKSMEFATVFGMVGAGLVVLVGAYKSQMLLMFIGAFGFYTCYQQRTMIKQAKASGAFGMNVPVGTYMPTDPALRASYENDDGDAKESFIARKKRERQEAQAAKQRARDDHQNAEIDRILDKIHEHGIQSLTAKEKKTLEADSERKRKR